MAKGCIELVDENASESGTRLGYFGLGLYDRSEVPEADKLLEVVGQIEGRTARIWLDTGCSMYVLSSRFAERNGIPGIRMRPWPVDLAVSSAKKHLTHKTRRVKLKIGNTVIIKSLSLLPVPQFDAIVGMQFFKENEVDLAGLEMGIIEVNRSKTSITDGDMDMEESPDSVETPMVGVKTLKKEIRRDQIEELYLTTIRHANDDMGISISTQEEPSDVPDWIQKEYGSVLREELPPRMPPYAINGPPDSNETGHATTNQRHFSIVSTRATRAKPTARSATKGWKDQTIDESIRCICPLCQEERW